MTGIVIRKLALDGTLIWQYDAELISRSKSVIFVQAPFASGEVRVADTWVRSGDRFLEAYYADRWHNIFEIHDLEDDSLKGWYCNLTRPAVLGADVIEWTDLALDLWVSPDGAQTVLDLDEFEALALGVDERARLLKEFGALRRAFETALPPW